jgi:PAS domain S-box-containing protein
VGQTAEVEHAPLSSGQRGFRALARRLGRALPLSLKVGLPALVLAVAASLVIGSMLARHTRQAFLDSVREQQHLIALLVASQYEAKEPNPAEMSAFLDDLRFSSPLLVSIRVYRSEGGRRVVWATAESAVAGERLPEHVFPVGTTRKRAWVGIVMSTADLDRALADARFNLNGVILLVSVFALVGWSAIFYVFIFRRAGRLARAARRVARGDLSVRLPEGTGPAGRDALSNVAREFDHMLRSLDARTRELAAAEARFRNLVELLPVVTYIATFGKEGRWVYVSPQIETLLGYSQQEWISDPGLWFRQVHPEDRGRVMANEERSWATGDSLAIEYRMHTKRGRVVWLRDDSVVVDTEDGTKVFRGVLSDVTDQKRAEGAVRELSLRNRLILDSAGEGIFGLDLDGRVTFANPSTAALTGHATAELLGQRGHDVFHYARADGTPYPANECHIYAAAREGVTRRVDDEVFWRKDGTSFPVEYTSTPIVRDGKVIGAVVTFADITERRRAEGALRQALDREREAGDRLRSLDEMKNAFLTAVSHELRTPLAAVLGFALTLQQEEMDMTEDERVFMLERLAVNARKLQRLLSDLLDVDRLARGIVEPKRTPVDVGALARRVAKETDIDGHSVEVRAESVVAEVDGSKIERIVENLLMNASKHTPPGTSILVRVVPQGDGALIVVEDEGPGVPDALKDVVFRPFERGPNTPTHAPGTGIGLSLVARFAELHGGRAWVEDRRGGGSSFRVFLPRVSAPIPLPAPAP